jgi:serine/threonine protein kinase
LVNIKFNIGISKNNNCTYQIFQLFEDIEKFQTINDCISNNSNKNLDFLKLKLSIDIICSISYLHQKNILLPDLNTKNILFENLFDGPKIFNFNESILYFVEFDKSKNLNLIKDINNNILNYNNFKFDNFYFKNNFEEISPIEEKVFEEIKINENEKIKINTNYMIDYNKNSFDENIDLGLDLLPSNSNIINNNYKNDDNAQNNNLEDEEEEFIELEYKFDESYYNNFTAPEIFDNKVSKKSDIYAYGCFLYEVTNII